MIKLFKQTEFHSELMQFCLNTNRQSWSWSTLELTQLSFSRTVYVNFTSHVSVMIFRAHSKPKCHN